MLEILSLKSYPNIKKKKLAKIQWAVKPKDSSFSGEKNGPINFNSTLKKQTLEE